MPAKLPVDRPCPRCNRTPDEAIFNTYTKGRETHCKECKSIINKERYDSDREKCKAQVKIWQQNNSERLNTCHRRRYKEKRVAVLAHYSKGQLKCSCSGCNESRLEFLTIHHVNGDGAEHRREIGSRSIYTWLLANNLPEGFAVLCMNCNHSLGHYGYCPHEREQQNEENA